jgi:acetyltransferase-like isoleucine patch superfamily enzyme
MSGLAGRIVRRLLRWKAKLLFGQRIEVFGNFTVINPANVRFGTNCAINHGVFILGHVGITVGNDVVLSARCMLLDAGLKSSNFANPDERTYEKGPILIGDGSWIGAGAIILPGVTIGERSVVGAGSVVTRDVADGSIVAGNPAGPIKPGRSV